MYDSPMRTNGYASPQSLLTNVSDNLMLELVKTIKKN